MQEAVHETPVWFLLGPALVLALTLFGLLVYGLTQPRYRVASAIVLAMGVMFLVLGTFVGVSRVEVRQVATVSDHSFPGVDLSSETPTSPPVSLPMPVQGSHEVRSPAWILLLTLLCGFGLAVWSSQGRKILGVVAVGAVVMMILYRARSVPQTATVVDAARHSPGQAREWLADVDRNRRAHATNGDTPVSTETDDPATASPLVTNTMELFESTRRTGETIAQLPDWITSPDESDAAVVTLDSGPQASLPDCEAALSSQLRSRLGTRLATLHPEVGAWQPDGRMAKDSGAVRQRVRETQVVRIDVADAVIREPLYREYWQVSLEPKVMDRLLAEWRPAASRERVGFLAGALAAATLVFGGMAFGLNRSIRRQAAVV